MASGLHNERVTVVCNAVGGHSRPLEQLKQKCQGKNEIALLGTSY